MPTLCGFHSLDGFREHTAFLHDCRDSATLKEMADELARLYWPLLVQHADEEAAFVAWCDEQEMLQAQAKGE